MLDRSLQLGMIRPRLVRKIAAKKWSRDSAWLFVQHRHYGKILTMKREAYPAARTIAPKLQAYFARHAADARHRSRTRATVPDAETIEAVIDAAFWASLRREEGYTPKISLAFLSPEETAHPLRFERPLALHPATLTRVAAVERPGFIWVCGAGRRSVCLGTTRIRRACVSCGSAAPGLLVVKHHSGDESGKFVNVAVLKGDQIKWVDGHAAGVPIVRICGIAARLWLASVLSSSGQLLVQLAISMRAHGHGGCLLVVPAGTRWRSQSWHRCLRSLAAILSASASEP
jgi:hypothetical protein